MLTGQGQPEGELPWYTKLVVVTTAVFSVALFAIPAGMLTWGFEAEAQRMFRKKAEIRRYERQRRRAAKLRQLWKRLNSDGEGNITADDLSNAAEALGKELQLTHTSELTADLIAQIIAECDTDGDGQISLAEFQRSRFLQVEPLPAESSDDELYASDSEGDDLEYEHAVIEDDDEDFAQLLSPGGGGTMSPVAGSGTAVNAELRGWMVRVEERLDAQSAQIGQLLELVAARLPPAAGS